MSAADNLDDACGGIDGELPALVPAGVYSLLYQSYATARMFGGQKLILQFSICAPKDYAGEIVCRFYNVRRIIGEPKKGGAFKVGFSSDFLREYATLFGIPSRLDRIPMSRFEGAVIRAKVRTVTTSNTKRSIPDALRYSTVDEILGLE